MAIPLGASPADAAGEHKAVRKQIKRLKKVASSGQLSDVEAAELKSLKKRAKALKAASQATGGDGASGSDGEATAEQAAPASKKAGSKKKRKAEGEQAAPADEQQQQQQQQPAGKKAKKGKAAAAAAEAAPGGMAAVGDRGLAASRPPLVKALYTEAAKVAAMSAADVAAWRKERKTKVEGCQLHPISSFAQSGECWVDRADVARLCAATRPPPTQVAVVPVLLHLTAPSSALLCRPVCRGAARDAQLPAAQPHPGAVPAHRAERAGPGGHCRHRLRQDAGVWPARAAPHPRTARGGCRIRCAAWTHERSMLPVPWLQRLTGAVVRHCGCGWRQPVLAARDAHAHLPPLPAFGAGKKPVALVVAPTRELALQIGTVLEEAGSQCGIGSARPGPPAAAAA